MADQSVMRGISLLREDFRRHEQLQAQRHADNLKRLSTIDENLSEAGERAAALEARVDDLKGDVKSVQSEVQNFKTSPTGVRQATDFNNRPVTFVEVRWIVGMLITALIAGATVTVWILSLAAKAKP